MSEVDVSQMLSRAFEFLKKLFKDLGNLLILIVLNIIPIINFIVTGYFAKVLREDLEEPPRISDFGGLFILGLKVFVATLIFLLIPMFVSLCVYFTVILPVIIIRPGLLPLDPFGMWYMLFVLGGLWTLLSLLLYVVFSFFLLPQLAIMVRTDKFAKLFALEEGWELIKKVGLVNYFVLFIVICAFGIIVTMVLGILPFIGPAIGMVFAEAFFFKALSYLANLKYPVPRAQPPAAAAAA